MGALTSLLLVHKYRLLFPLSIVEAPLMSIVAGFLTTLNHFDPLIAFGIIVLGDFVGDTLLYVAGRWGGGLLARLGRRFAKAGGRALALRRHFAANRSKAIVISKLVHGVGFTGLILAGGLRVPFGLYIATCLAVTIVQSAILMLAGILCGEAYVTLADYLRYFGLATSVVAIVGVLMLYRRLVGRTI